MKSPFSIDLTNKTAVITGGGGVLGRSFADALAMSGAKVAIIDLKLEYAEAAAEIIKNKGGQAIAVQADVLNISSLKAAADTIRSAFGVCDILINGAGGNHPKGTTSKEFLDIEDIKNKTDGLTTFFDLDPEGIRFVLDLNFLGTLLPTQAFAKEMAMAKGGTIINISSMNAFRPLTKIPAYSAAKAAVSNLTQWLAVHFASANIRVNAIAPGFFLTDQNRSLLMNPDGTPTARAGKILDHTPMGRFGKPEELTGTLLWLCDERASGFVNGIVVPVDGGFSSYSGV